jgi:prevent-host-death family protein
MKIEIGSYEAKTKLPELLRQVKSGMSFTITNRGEAIADLVPSTGARKKDKVDAATKLKVFMLADPIRGVDIKHLNEEGRA